MHRYVPPHEFEQWRVEGERMGFKYSYCRTILLSTEQHRTVPYPVQYAPGVHGGGRVGIASRQHACTSVQCPHAVTGTVRGGRWVGMAGLFTLRPPLWSVHASSHVTVRVRTCERA